MQADEAATQSFGDVGAPHLLGFRLELPETDATAIIDEDLLRGERVRFSGTGTSGTLHLVHAPLSWQAEAGASYSLLAIEIVRLASRPTLYLVLVEEDPGLQQRGSVKLGENLRLVALELEDLQVQARTLDARLGRPPSSGRLKGDVHVFTLDDARLMPLD